MPSPTTALEIIGDALGLTNAVGVDQVLTAAETADCLRKFNDLLENLSTQNLAVYGQADQSFNTVAGQATYTIGTGGNWNTTRPVRINGAYSTISGALFPAEEMSQAEYNAIAVKAQAGAYASNFLYVNDFPLGLVTLWPVPDAVVAMTFSIDRVLTAVASASAAISFPPGYAHMFTTNLAVLLGPLFGKKMAQYPELVAEARTSLGDVKRANKTRRVLRFDTAYSTGNF